MPFKSSKGLTKKNDVNMTSTRKGNLSPAYPPDKKNNTGNNCHHQQHAGPHTGLENVANQLTARKHNKESEERSYS